MNASVPPLSLLARIKLQWNLLMRAILHLWVREKVLPADLHDEGIDSTRPTVYLMDQYAYSSVLILDRACQEEGLPRPLLPVEGFGNNEPRSWASLRRMTGLLIRRPELRRSSKLLARMVERAIEDPEFDLQVIPVTVFVGRAPDKETGLAHILFSEDWEVVGRLRRLLSTIVNGRHTFVQFSRPVSLRELADEGLGTSRSLSKVSRILRTHFRRVRDAAIGPDLSHRRTVVDVVLRSPPVKAAIEAKAEKDGVPFHKAYEAAEDYAYEIAADYNYTFIRVASLALTWIWNRIYDGVKLERFDQFREQATEHEVIYVPCHRSHMDYLLLSYILYHNGLMPPHVAAGVNLNLPVVGRFLRMGGAFFLRRSFRAQPLYSTVFNEYLSHIQARGTPIEYFIEGTRSRTGRLLPPRAGMLSMSVRAYLRNPVRPIMFQPVYFGYERLVEGNSYIKELSGARKKSETIGGLFGSWKVLRERYGQVHVSFGEPVYLDTLLDETDPDWRESIAGTGDRPRWLNPLIDRLGTRVMTAINEAADVNPVNLLATILLGTPRHAMDEAELCRQIDLVRRLLINGPFSDGISVTDLPPEEIISLGLEMGILAREAHPLGDIVRIAPEKAVLLTYFRNNMMHLMAVPSLIASCFVNNRRFDRDNLKRIALAVYAFLKPELFMPWGRRGFVAALEQDMDLLIQEGLLEVSAKGTHLVRGEGGSLPAQQLRWLALGMLPSLERYYIVVAVLSKNGSGMLSRGELENLCSLTAQRIALLNDFGAPEFHDKTLFRQLITQMRQAGVLETNDENRIEFGSVIHRMAEDAKVILSKDVRHSIIQVAPHTWETARGGRLSEGRNPITAEIGKDAATDPSDDSASSTEDSGVEVRD